MIKAIKQHEKEIVGGSLVLILCITIFTGVIVLNQIELERKQIKSFCVAREGNYNLSYYLELNSFDGCIVTCKGYDGYELKSGCGVVTTI